jgi:hypothetical protein
MRAARINILHTIAALRDGAHQRGYACLALGRMRPQPHTTSRRTSTHECPRANESFTAKLEVDCEHKLDSDEIGAGQRRRGGAQFG